MWDQLCIGALGVIVLVDTRRIEDSFEAVDYFERTGIPFLVAVNEFEGAQFAYTAMEVREALQLRAEVPVVMCDARSRTSSVNVLIALVKHLQSIDYRTVRPAAPEPAAHEGSYI